MYEHRVDHKRRRVITVWGPVVTDDSLLHYQRTVWGDDAVSGYDELIDFRGLEQVEVSSDGLRRVAIEAASDDAGRHGHRFAIVVGTDLTYGLSRMYELLRTSQASSSRIVRTFKVLDEALAWLDEPL